MKVFYRRVILTIITIFYSTLSALAGVDGRWYALDEGISRPSPFGMVVGGIICIVVGVFFTYGFVLNSKKENDNAINDNTLGCMSKLLIIGGIGVILFALSRCSG